MTRDDAHRAADAAVLDSVRRAFSTYRRPEHFTDRDHCSECAEHDDVLRTRDLETLSVGDVGNPGWDPICFATDAAFGYYFPALARLALDEPTKEFGWYGDQLLFHLCHDGSDNRRLAACTAEQRRAVADLLRHLSDTRGHLGEKEELLDAVRLWSDETIA
ncbi:MAG: hypothetical protein KDC48_11935 [Planctomycetes bacterium]|nr:hypothetical protein [Planctomycetota bacterium]